MALNPLASPKGIKLNCELCQKPALLQCERCRVTYYCGTEHQATDWIGIHDKICQLLIPLRMPLPPVSGLEEERDHLKKQTLQRQENLLHLTQTAGQRLLFEKRYQYVIPAAMQSIKFAIQLHGLKSVELVPSYLMLGEAYIGLGKLAQAEGYLSQAQWTVTKAETCSNAFKSKLFRNLGLLCASQGKQDEALGYMSEDIYYSSLAQGTHGIGTAAGYFNMANVFLQQTKLDVAFSLYLKVLDIWHGYLSALVTERTTTAKDQQGIGPGAMQEQRQNITILDEAQEAEAFQTLKSIISIQEEQVTMQAVATRRAYHCMAMLNMILNKSKQAKSYIAKALAIQGPDQDTNVIAALSQQIDVA